MRKVTFGCANSLDNFIARLQDDELLARNERDDRVGGYLDVLDEIRVQH